MYTCNSSLIFTHVNTSGSRFKLDYFTNKTTKKYNNIKISNPWSKQDWFMIRVEQIIVINIDFNENNK